MFERSMVSSFNRSVTGQFSRRSLSLRSPSVFIPTSRKMVGWFSLSFNGFILFCLLVSFSSIISCVYLVFFPSLGHPNGVGVLEQMDSSSGCNVFNGSWVLDESYPLYNSSECPFAEKGFNCLANGRRDRDYQKWRWKPQYCDLPAFDVHRILGALRGKRVVFVGDSMSRSQWESMICLLMTGVADKKTVYEVNRNKITKRIRFIGVRFSSFNFTIEFVRSVFLVRPGKPPRHSPKRVLSAVKLDVVDDFSKRWIDSDVLIFNSGQWWTPGKLFNAGYYFQVNGTLKLGMPIDTAFRTAMSTWASWVKTSVNTSRTHVFFRTFEPSHWSSDRKFCKVTRYPMTKTSGKGYSEFSNIISEVVADVKVPVTVLRVTYMSTLRSDAHVVKWSDTPSILDCSHWCLPGVPDSWNELLFSYISAKYA